MDQTIDHSHFTEAEMIGPENDALMLDAEQNEYARRWQQMTTFQDAIEIGLTREEAEAVAGVTYDEYVLWHKTGNNVHNHSLIVSPNELHNEVNIVGADVADTSVEMKKSFDDIFVRDRKNPEVLLKAMAIKKHEGGKRTEQVQVQGKHGVFTRNQTVGSDKQKPQKKNIMGKQPGKEQHTPEMKMKHTMLQRFGDFFKKIGGALADKLSELKDPEKIKKAGQSVQKHVEATANNNATGALADDASKLGEFGQRQVDAEKARQKAEKDKADKAKEKGKDAKPEKKKAEMPKKKEQKQKQNDKEPKKKFEATKKGGK